MLSLSNTDFNPFAILDEAKSLMEQHKQIQHEIEQTYQKKINQLNDKKTNTNKDNPDFVVNLPCKIGASSITGLYTGFIAKNLPHGYGRFEYTENNNKLYYVGSFRNGNSHGKGKLISSDGTKITGTVQYGNFTGECDVTFKTGNFYHGSYQNGKIHGYGMYRFNDGTVYEGLFINEKFIKGKKTYCFKMTEEGLFMGGYLVQGIRVHKTVIMEGVFKDGKLYYGKYKDDYETKEGYFINDKLIANERYLANISMFETTPSTNF